MTDEYGGDVGGSSSDGLKRKRSSSPERHPSMFAPPSKQTKMQPGSQVDFLASLPAEDPLQLVDIDDSLRFIQQHLEQYSGVIERHESLAANLGAKLQAPNTIKRFERMFMHPMKILANHGKETNTVTWLDVVRFYEEKPNQMKLHPKDGEMVCQFYTKQCRVEITEDEYEFIRSGQPQKMLPTGTVPADEEKELGTIEFMEQKISQVVKMSDAVSGRGKALMSRLKARKNALAEKREKSNGMSATSPTLEGSRSDKRSVSPVLGGFTAVNAQSRDNSLNGITTTSAMSRPLVSPAVRTELSQIFASNRDRLAFTNPEYARSHKSRSRAAEPELPGSTNPTNAAPPATPGLVSSNHRPSPAEKVDNDGPFKAEMLSRMDKMPRYTVVRPPCDRCRRLQIDCQKNLTACLGCTRKHAKCSWKDVTDQELRENPPMAASAMADSGRRGSLTGSAGGSEENGPPLPVRDEELLGEDDSEDEFGVPSRHSNAHHETSPGSHEQYRQQGSATSPQAEISSSHFTAANYNVPPAAIGPAAAPSASISPPSQSATSHDPHRPLQNHASSTNNASNSLPHAQSDGSSTTIPFSSNYSGITSEQDKSQGNQSNLSSLKFETSSSQHTGGNSTQSLPRLPSFPSMLGDRIIDNPQLLGTATGDRLVRDAQDEIERLQPKQDHSYQPQQRPAHQEGPGMHGHPGGMTNGMAKV